MLTAVFGMIDNCKAVALQAGSTDMSEMNEVVDMDGDRIRMIGSLG